MPEIIPSPNMFSAATWIIAGITIVSLLLQVSLWMRYSVGSWKLRRWGSRLEHMEADDLLVALRAGPERRGWLKELVRKMVAAAGFLTQSFRAEYSVEILEDMEGKLFRHVFVRFCLGSVMIFGLAGTFFAFSQLISSSSLTETLLAISKGQNSPDHYAKLSKSMLSIYDGFGLAFISSLAGLVSTLLLGFADQVIVSPAKARFIHQWVSLIHDWEQVVFKGREPQVQPPEESETIPDLSSSYAPPANLVPIPALTPEDPKKWDALVESLQNSQAFFDKCLIELEATGKSQREEMQALVAEVVVSMREVVNDLGKQVQDVSEAKADHLKKVDDSIREHFLKRESEWQEALQKSLDAFKSSLQESHGEAKKEQASIRKDALEAGERVAKAVKAEAQNALAVVTNNQETVQRSQQETLQAIQEVAVLVGSVAQLVKENKESVESYISELTLSLKAWKTAPRSVEESLQKVNDVLATLAAAVNNMSGALEKTSQIPSRWQAEINDLSVLFNEVADRRKADSLGNRMKSKAMGFVEWIQTIIRNLRR